MDGVSLAVRGSEFKVDHDLLEAGKAYRNRKPYVVLGGQPRGPWKGGSETGHDLLRGTRHYAASFLYFGRQPRCASGSSARAAACTGPATANRAPDLPCSRVEPDEKFFDFCRNLRLDCRHDGSLAESPLI